LLRLMGYTLASAIAARETLNDGYCLESARKRTTRRNRK
jgi:hypothetical protein